MKQLLLILTITIFSFSAGNAQSLFLGVEGGPAFPIGAFGGNDDGEDGFAKTGLNAFASAAYGINDKIRVGAKLGFLSHGVQEGALSFVNNSPWESTVILGQVVFTQPIASKLYLEGEAGIGLIRTAFPDATVNILGVQITRSGETGSGLAYQVGGAFRYDLSEDFAFRLSANYLGGNPGFEQGGEKYSQGIGMVNLNWGIMFAL